MSVDVSNWVWKHSQASGNDLIVLLKIADNANDDGGGAYPGVDYLAKSARISKRAAYDCLRRLKASGELAEEKGGGGRGRKTTYRVLMGNGAEAASNPPSSNGVVKLETVRSAARNGADPRSAYKEEPSLNRPTPTAPNGEPAKNGKIDNGGRVVGDWIKAQPARPDDATVGMVAQAVGKALKRHVPPEAVRAGLAHMSARGLDASMATRCIDAAAAKQSPDLQRASRTAHLSALKADTPDDERVPFGARFTPEQADALLGGAG